ncbi:peptidoglycan recognition family protein [Streptomyces synnematoformans]|uniref:N-acetylmuramoyl-L-alanine amidase domain-containing protein n=1 Tax=Streptomyces synnematoformans TaxID=415721 RepID=A0ABP5J187_9ACTN
MAWYPGATKMELQPESDDQAAIRPTQFIVHSMAAPWTPRRLYEYWRDSTNLESHFGLGFDGTLAQFIGTETRADANASANRRGDGTGAISIETASNTSSTDPWTAEQIEALIKLGVWAHRRHGIPLRICRSSTDPGFGWHRLHSAWSTGGTACPGPKRITQFKEVVMPGIRARAAGKDDMPLSDKDIDRVAKAVCDRLANQDGVYPAPEDAASYDTNKFWAFKNHVTTQTRAARGARRAAEAAAAQTGALTGMVQQLLDAGGSLTAAQAQAAAEAGARAALAELGDALNDGN